MTPRNGEKLALTRDFLKPLAHGLGFETSAVAVFNEATADNCMQEVLAVAQEITETWDGPKAKVATRFLSVMQTLKDSENIYADLEQHHNPSHAGTDQVIDTTKKWLAKLYDEYDLNEAESLQFTGKTSAKVRPPRPSKDMLSEEELGHIEQTLKGPLLPASVLNQDRKERPDSIQARIVSDTEVEIRGVIFDLTSADKRLLFQMLCLFRGSYVKSSELIRLGYHSNRKNISGLYRLLGKEIRDLASLSPDSEELFLNDTREKRANPKLYFVDTRPEHDGQDNINLAIAFLEKLSYDRLHPYKADQRINPYLHIGWQEYYDVPQFPEMDKLNLRQYKSIDVYLRTLRQEASHVTYEQEANLAFRIEAGVLAEERLRALEVKDRAGCRNENDARDIADLKQLVKDGKMSSDCLVLSQSLWVAYIARRFAHNDDEWMDLITVGNLGLLHAIEKYDYTKGFRLSGYAKHWIKQHIGKELHQIRAQASTAPLWIREKGTKILTAADTLAQRLGRVPTLRELATATGMKSKTIELTLNRLRGQVSLDAPTHEGHTVKDTVKARLSPPPYDAAREKLFGLFKRFSPREQIFIMELFGFNADNEPRTIDQIAQMQINNLQGAHAKAIGRRVMAKLQHPANASAMATLLYSDSHIF